MLSEDFWVMATRIGVAVVLSGLIGFERESREQAAGLRTHLLVGVGSCLMMLLSLFGFEKYLEEDETIDLARIPSYVISGIGFLGAGTILVRDTKVHGLTTAASIWVVASLGLIIGIGMYDIAILATAIILFSLHVLKRFGRKQNIKADTETGE